MGGNLDQVHADLARIASALMEGKKGPKAGSPKERKGKGPGRKKRKQQRTQEKLYQGQEPVKSKSGRSVPIGEPYQPPAARPPATTRTQAAQPTPQPRPSRAVPTTPPPTKPAEPAKTPEQAAKPPAKPSAAPKPARPTPKPRAVSEPRRTAPGAPLPEPRKPSLWQRVLGKKPSEPAPKKPSLPGRAVGAFKRIAGLFKRKLLGEAHLPRTLLAMGMTEERSSTTFKKCSPGAMIATPYLRHSLPMNQFVNPDDENPTFPIRSNCRASMGGVTRALQKDMSGAGEATVKQVLQRINQMGGTRGKTKFKAWGTGVGGKRMETYRGKPGTPKRTDSLAKKLGISKKKASALHGISTGKSDMVKHTPPYSPVGGAKGPAGNREVNRADQAHAKPSHKQSKRKEKRKAASRAVTIARGKALAGR